MDVKAFECFCAMRDCEDNRGEMEKFSYKKLTQVQMIAIGYVLIILCGALLLMLPISTRDGAGTSFIDAAFTSASASCVTGLVVADTCQNWTVFGQCVILILIQIGGLGFMTIGVFFAVLLRRKIGLWTRGALQESVNILQIGGIVRLAKKIIMGTLFFEGVGALLLAIRFHERFGWLKATYYGIFHSVSAFCNAGFDLMGVDEPYSSFTGYYDDWLINLTIMSLIVIGGIGFFVWNDLSIHKLHFKHYRLHTKIVLTTTAVLIFGGAALFYIFESNNLLVGMSEHGKILSSLFSSVTARTAGFNTIDTASLEGSSKMLSMVLMFIGGSPGSTAGGIKTTTFVVLLAYIGANLKNNNSCNVFGRRLAEGTIRKASTVLCTNLFLSITATIIITAVQSLPLTDVLFEVISAMGTVGMSTGITRELNWISQAVLIFLMYCGRIGSLTFALSFKGHKQEAPVMQPIEDITIG